ncbi:MAG: hypothetical protein MJ010_04130 [Paludibacteraceae bacterium]|nr:hypothetical protein [Paludibacteraceae bacterium]
MSDIIKFYKGEETGIVHENYNDINTSLFKDQYLKALSEIGTYLDEVKKNMQQGKLNRIIKQCPYVEDYDSDYVRSESAVDLNNIFAFIGERGTGKTSFMDSIAYMLNPYMHDNGKMDKKESFLIIKAIDPTTFDDKTNMLQVVVGVMFEAFKEKVKHPEPIYSDKGENEFNNNKQELLTAFQRVKDCIKIIVRPDTLNTDDDNIAQLAEMASVSKLGELVKDLITSYLKFFKRTTLVLQIDDIDLQTRYAYKMVEHLRKYFMHDNVLVLMAVKLEQLSKVIELENTKTFKELIDTKQITPSTISEMAERYLLKLIPVNHRIFMPTADVYAESALEYYESRETNKPEKNWTSVKYAITSLIYDRCRFLFYHSKGVVSPIVPRNLRELRHLFAMLYKMQPYNKKSPDLNNKVLFLNYFNFTWVNSNIASEDYSIVNDIRNIKDAATINKVVLQLLCRKYENILPKNEDIQGKTDAKSRRAKDSIEEVILRIIDVTNASYNISIADVYVVLNYVKQRISSLSDRMLIFYIESFYSIKLYQYYDEISDTNENSTTSLLFPNKCKGKEKKSKKEIDDSIVKLEIVDGYSNYEVLAGGSFINTEITKLTPDEQDNSESRDRRRIDFQRLKELAKKVAGEPINKDNINELRLVEFFALCISQTVEATNEKANLKYRSYNELYYKIPDNSKYGSALFNLGSFFFNTINVKRAYERLAEGLFNKAANAPDLKISKTKEKKSISSLYEDLLKSSKELRNNKYLREHALLSCTAIRNFEVYETFVQFVEFDRLDRSKSKYSIENLKKFFDKVSKFVINNYDRDVDNDIPFTINFNYVKVISDALNMFDPKEFERIFNIDTELYDNKTSFDIESIILTELNKDEFSLTVLRDAGTRTLRKTNKKGSAIEKEWKGIGFFEGDIKGQRTSQGIARIILTAFKVRNNLK